MSFSSDVKNELMKKFESSSHCKRAELAGILAVNGRLVQDDGAARHLSIRAESEDFAKRISKLLEQVMGKKNAFEPVKVEGKTGYRIIISDETDLGDVMSSLKIEYDENPKNYISIHELLTERSCCKRAFVKGAFLAGGSVMDPNKAYQLEIACTTLKNAESLQKMLKNLHLDAKMVARKSRYVVYIKDGNVVSDILSSMGAMSSVMEFENVRILKDIRNSVNREVNCDTANIAKAANAAAQQLEDIMLIKDKQGLDSLPEQLRVVAQARLQSPYCSLKELGERIVPPLGKSGIKHRLMRISEIADKLR